jgi:hypothetical protein
MNPSAAAIVAELKHAFPPTRTAPFFALTDSRQGKEPILTERAFADRHDWTQIEPAWLDDVPDGWSNALSWLTDEALWFYIPAYISADVTCGLERVDLLYHLVKGFDDESRDAYGWMDERESLKARASVRWRGLTRPQAAAIVHYLEWKVEQIGVEEGHEIVQALKAYWYERGGVP